MSLQQLNPCEAEKENQGISSIYQGRHFSSRALAELERCVSVVLLLMETQPAKKTGKPKTRQPKGSVIYVISRLCCTTFIQDDIMKNTSTEDANYPIIHEKVFHDESSYQGLQRSSKLVRGKESDMANSDQRGYEMLQVAWV